MDTKNHLTASKRALDMRNRSLWPTATTPMLRSSPQLRRSPEIELFEDRVGSLAGKIWDPCSSKITFSHRKTGFLVSSMHRGTAMEPHRTSWNRHGTSL